jgi:hypothetical protein
LEDEREGGEEEEENCECEGSVKREEEYSGLFIKLIPEEEGQIGIAETDGLTSVTSICIGRTKF